MGADVLEPGDPAELGGFRLTGRLGEGGQGVVYLGRGPDGERVAVKVLKADVDARARERLSRELAACERIAPFCTARVIGSDTGRARPYVVSEYVEGPSLQQRVDREGPLRDGELDRLVVGTATALIAIHGAGVLHRDLKPANVLLGPDGPRVVDFGIARPIDSDTVTTQLVGTPAYLAPEQLNGAPPSPAADVFAWASTMVFAATGRPPFGDDLIAAVLNRIAHSAPDLTGVPDRLRGALAACLAKDPARRPGARSLLMRLVDPSVAAGAEPDADPRVSLFEIAPSAGRTAVLPTREQGPAREQGRTRVLAPVGAAAALALLAVAGWLSLGRPGDGGRVPGGPSAPAGSGPASDRPEGVPGAFDGMWQGEGTRTEDGVEISEMPVPVLVSLAGGRRGGGVELPEERCAGDLRLTAATDEQLTFRATFHSGGCRDAAVTLIRRGGGELGYRSDDHGGSVIQAVLHRSR